MADTMSRFLCALSTACAVALQIRQCGVIASSIDTWHTSSAYGPRATSRPVVPRGSLHFPSHSPLTSVFFPPLRRLLNRFVHMQDTQAAAFVAPRTNAPRFHLQRSQDHCAVHAMPSVAGSFHKSEPTNGQKGRAASETGAQQQRCQQQSPHQAASCCMSNVTFTTHSCGSMTTTSGRPQRLRAAAACLRMRGHLAPPDPYSDPTLQLEQISAAVSNAQAAGVLPDASMRAGTTLGPQNDDNGELQSKVTFQGTSRCRKFPTPPGCTQQEESTHKAAVAHFQPVPPRIARELSCSLKGFRADEDTCSVAQSSREAQGANDSDGSSRHRNAKRAKRQQTDKAATDDVEADVAEVEGAAGVSTEAMVALQASAGRARSVAADRGAATLTPVEVPRALTKPRSRRPCKHTSVIASRIDSKMAAAAASGVEVRVAAPGPSAAASPSGKRTQTFPHAETGAVAAFAVADSAAPLPQSSVSRSDLLRKALGLPLLQTSGFPGSAPQAAVVKQLNSVAPPRASVQQRLRAHSDAAVGHRSCGVASSQPVPQHLIAARRMVPAQVPSGTVATGSRHRGQGVGAGKPEDEWTSKQLACLEQAYHGTIAPNAPNFWQLVAAQVPGKYAMHLCALHLPLL
jgi:hypothetical protein